MLYRRMLRDGLQAVAEGRDPMNVFRDPTINCIDLPVEKDKLGASKRRLKSGVWGGNTAKYSPILQRINNATP